MHSDHLFAPCESPGGKIIMYNRTKPYTEKNGGLSMTAAQPRLASAVMLLRDTPAGQGIEVFMVRRVIQSDFMPDVYVFPGGSVTADDRAAELAEGVCTPVAPGPGDPEGRTNLGTGVRAAAIR